MPNQHDFVRFPELTNRQMGSFYFESPHKQILEDFNAKVVKVIDGDTIRVRWEERDFDFPVRLIDIAAPEKNEEGGIESQHWLEDQILEEDITVGIDRNLRVGKWGRILGRVFHRGLDLNEQSINLGFAVRWEDRKAGQFINLDEELKEVFR